MRVALGRGGWRPNMKVGSDSLFSVLRVDMLSIGVQFFVRNTTVPKKLS